MKTIRLLLILLIVNVANCQELVKSKDLGLVGYLTYVKQVAEYKMNALAKDPNYTAMPDKAKQFNSEYTMLKLSVDLLINQMNADMLNCNRLRLYRKLDKFLKSEESLPVKYKVYGELLKQIDGQFTSFIIKKYGGGALAGPGLDEITGVATEVREIITSARDFREKKIQSINSLLKELKLTPLSEIIKPKEKDSKN